MMKVVPMAANPQIISAGNLVKRFKQVAAINGISFAVRTGEVFAFLGPNGAGKTTTIKMLTTLLTPTIGQAQVDGFDIAKNPAEVRGINGYSL